MIFLLPGAIAAVICLVYFLNQKRQSDATWQRYRQRYRERRRHSPADQPIDPNFDFDAPSADSEQYKPGGPK